MIGSDTRRFFIKPDIVTSIQVNPRVVNQLIENFEIRLNHENYGPKEVLTAIDELEGFCKYGDKECALKAKTALYNWLKNPNNQDWLEQQAVLNGESTESTRLKVTNNLSALKTELGVTNS